MNIPNVPTDNLYKFETLTGLILIISTTIFTIFSMQQIRSKLVEAKINLEKIKFEENYKKEQIATVINDEYIVKDLGDQLNDLYFFI